MRSTTPLLGAALAVCPLLLLPGTTAPGGTALPQGGWTVRASAERTAVRGGTEVRLSGAPTASRPSRPAQARTATGAVFRVRYTGFTPEQRDAFQAAVDTWSRLLSSRVPIRVEARLTALPPGVLGSAGAAGYAVQDGSSSRTPQTQLPLALANARAGRDLAPLLPDIEAEFSSSSGLFSYGVDPRPDRYDFSTVVLHEIGHGLGFGGTMEVRGTGKGRRGYWDPGTPGPLPSAFDRFAASRRADGRAVPLLTLPRGSAALADALTGGRTVWTGPAAVQANGGRQPVLYAPRVWEPGSSYSHLDEDTYPYDGPDALMTPVLDPGQAVPDPGAVALGMLADLGWGSAPRFLRLSGPSSIRVGARVPVTGAAPPGSSVRLYFQRRGSVRTTPGAAPGFVLQRTLPVGRSGTFSTSYRAVDDHRYYAQVGRQVSSAVLTRVRPSLAGSTGRVDRAGGGVPRRTR